jgi:hypothetical protein
MVKHKGMKMDKYKVEFTDGETGEYLWEEIIDKLMATDAKIVKCELIEGELNE